ncbi:hypothetical protein GOV04_04265 [Candidatus Woesearchaeota archaeon]|nr:hypothetical protein [Candidatus Woesearchaeota archaeon]
MFTKEPPCNNDQENDLGWLADLLTEKLGERIDPDRIMGAVEQYVGICGGATSYMHERLEEVARELYGSKAQLEFVTVHGEHKELCIAYTSSNF